MKHMKRIVVLGLILALMLTLTACGKQKFDPNELTEAEQAAKAVVNNIEFTQGTELKEVDVMCAEDLEAVLGGEAGVSGWDISDAKYAVILRVGAKSDSDTSTSDETADADSEPNAAQYKTSVALVDADNKVIYNSFSRTSDTSSEDASDLYGDSDMTAQDARYELAQKTLAVEDYIENNREAAAAFDSAVADALLADPDYVYTIEYINTAKSMNVISYINMLEEVRAAELAVEILERAEGGDPKFSEADASNLAAAMTSLEEQRWELLTSRANVELNLNTLKQEHTDEIAAFETAAAALKADNEDYMYELDYLKLCLSSEVCNQYDVYTRQISIYSVGVDMLAECMELSDLSEIAHKCELLSTSQSAQSEYVNALKTYAQCVINLENFEAENEAALSAYDSALQTAKDKAGDNYAKDMDFIKADVQYGELIKQRDAYTSAVNESKSDADELKAENDEEIAELEADYEQQLKDKAESKAKAALIEYCTGLTVIVSEYDALDGEWGMLPQEYLDYQNELLTYYVKSSSSSSYKGSSSYSGSSSSGSSGTTGAGGYDMPNSSDKSFSDYVKRVDPDLYNSMKDIYDSLD